MLNCHFRIATKPNIPHSFKNDILVKQTQITFHMGIAVMLMDKRNHWMSVTGSTAVHMMPVYISIKERI